MLQTAGEHYRKDSGGRIMFSNDERERYARHLMLEGVGEEGQERLRAGRVLVIGAGGLGSPAAQYLAAAGVGSIGIADGDRVELSNLQRQIIHGSSDLGRPKLLSARDRMLEINPGIQVETIGEWLTAENIGGIVGRYDFVLDATDNFEAKFLINDACLAAGTSYSHGGILRFRGQTMTVIPGKSTCYRCIFPEPPEPEVALSCSKAGVLGVLPGVIGAIQATEAVKFLLGIGELLTSRLLTYDLLTMRFREVALGRNPDCPVCGELF
jgi:molybdopterin-synthase adenylyltransferase